jgi:hypothetical protein
VRGLFAGTPLTLLALLVQKYKHWRSQGAAIAEARVEEEGQGDESIASAACCSVSLLYWYKSTNTDAQGGAFAGARAEEEEKGDESRCFSTFSTSNLRVWSVL